MESLSESEKPVLITQSEFMRRMKEQQAAGGGGMNMMGVMPEMYNLVSKYKSSINFENN